MRDWLKRGLVLMVGLGAVVAFEHWYFRTTLEGIVLRVDDGERALFAPNLSLDEADLKQSYLEWFLGGDELIEVTNMERVEPGSRVSITFDGRTLSENSPTVAAMDYEVLDVAFSVVDSSIPVSSSVPSGRELAFMFPSEEGWLQVFANRDSYGFLQRLSRVMEVGDGRQIYFEGYTNTGGFNLVYHVENGSVVEFVRNFESSLGFGEELLLHSIIQRKTILKAPLEVGNSWAGTFSFQERLHEAVTTIVRVGENVDGKLEIETQTVVEGIEGFANKRYEEVRVFVEGSGMTQFANSSRLGERDLFTYAFSLITEKMD